MKILNSSAARLLPPWGRKQNKARIQRTAQQLNRGVKAVLPSALFYGKKSDSPSILGIYEENGVWYIYGTDDRGNIMVYDQGEEEKMVDTMYQEIINNEKFYLKKHDIIK